MGSRTQTLDSLCELIVDCPHSTPKWTDSGIVVLRNQNIRNGQLDLSSPSFTNEEDYQKRTKRATPQAGDIVFTREAPMGEVCLIPEGLKCCLGQRQVLLRPRSDVSGEYVFWALQSPHVQHQISWNEGTGTTVSNVRIPVLKALQIPRHPANEDDVASVLSSLARRIELNQQTNHTLEQMAQALFTSWFVDFDPVVDNALAAGNPIPDELAHRVEVRKKVHALPDFQPLPEHIRNLFPNEFEQTGEPTLGIEGWIPKGWQVSTLGNETDFQNGFAFKSKELSSEEKDGIPIIKMGHIRRGGGFNPEGTKSYLPKDALTDKQAKCFAQKGDLLMAMTDMKSNMAILGNTALVPKSNVYLINQRVGRIRRKQSSHLDYPFLSLLTNHPAVVEELRSRANSGVQVNLTTAAIKETKILVPPKEVHSEFHSAVKSLLERQFANDENASNLRALRDLLLPKLISGEIQLDSSGSSINQEADVQGV